VVDDLTSVIGNARQFVKDNIWVRDDKGRYVLFRGVNFASRCKLFPYLPIVPFNRPSITAQNLKTEIELVRPQLEYLKTIGFNIVRLLVMWKAIEPTPNPDLNKLMPEGEQYLNMVKEIVDALYIQGLFVIIDFHQDIAHEVYNGDGFPDWALAIDETHPRPLQATHKDKGWAAAYYLNPLVRHTLQSFWKNNLRNIEAGLENYPVRTHLEKAITQTVKFFKSLKNNQGHPAILGFEIFNEPHHVGLGKTRFEESFLKEFYSNVMAEINKVDDKVFVFIQPRADWNIYPANEVTESKLDWSKFSTPDSISDLQLAFVRDPTQIRSWLPTASTFLDQFKLQGVFSFHYYDPWTLFYGFFNTADNMRNKQLEWPKIFEQMQKEAASRSLIPFLTEFGGSQDWETLPTNLGPDSVYHTKQIRAYMNLQYIQVESYLLNSIYWNYDLYETKENKDNWNLENFSLLGPNRSPRNIDIVARPYPMYSSAKPLMLSFDLETKYWVLIISGSIANAPTIIYIPYFVHFLPAFSVWATSTAVKWDQANQLLYWYPDNSQEYNQIIATPSQDLNHSLLPKESKDLLKKTVHVGKFGAK
jgi:hypothetical protein